MRCKTTRYSCLGTLEATLFRERAAGGLGWQTQNHFTGKASKAADYCATPLVRKVVGPSSRWSSVACAASVRTQAAFGTAERGTTRTEIKTPKHRGLYQHLLSKNSRQLVFARSHGQIGAQGMHGDFGAQGTRHTHQEAWPAC